MLPTYRPQPPPSNADEKSHKELYVANLQAKTPPSNADKKSRKELYVADLQATTPYIKCG